MVPSQSRTFFEELDSELEGPVIDETRIEEHGADADSHRELEDRERKVARAIRAWR